MQKQRVSQRKNHYLAVLLLVSAVFVFAFLSLLYWQQKEQEVVKANFPEDHPYTVYQSDGDMWKLIETLEYSTTYSTEVFSVIPDSSELQLRFTREGGDFADIEQIELTACGQVIRPEYARYTDGSGDVLDDIVADDLNVVISQDKVIEVQWNIPPSCLSTVQVKLKANAYGHAGAFHQTLDDNLNPLVYSIDSSIRSLVIDGEIDEVDGLQNALYSPYWQPNTGHPDGTTYIYVNNDRDNLYVSLDITMDNTNEIGEDFAEVIVDGQTFRIDDFNDTYGLCGFGLTSKVSYKHQYCEFAIPRTELPDGDLTFEIRYYGTGGLFYTLGPPIFPEDPSDAYVINTMRDTTIDEPSFYLLGSGNPGTRTILHSPGFVPRNTAADIVELSGGEYGFIYLSDRSATGEGYDVNAVRVATPGAAEQFDVELFARGQTSNGDDGVSKLVQVIADAANGFFVLYLQGDIDSGSEVGGLRLDHVGPTGVITNLDSFGWYNGDMISDGAGGVYVLYNIGEEGPTGSTLTHGSVRKYTSAGQDIPFGTVSVSSDSTTIKRGAVMIPDDTSSPDILVFWYEPTGAAPGVYGQKISSAGAVQWAARGELLLTSALAGGFSANEDWLRAVSGAAADLVYVGYRDSSDDWRL